jgi:hypothetical protein
VTAPRLPDERLAWLAARDYCTEKASARTGLKILHSLNLLFRSRDVRGVRNEGSNEKLKLYAVAVDQLVSRLNQDERQILRTSRQLPPWFLPAVDEAYSRLARARRS